MLKKSIIPLLLVTVWGTGTSVGMKKYLQPTPPPELSIACGGEKKEVGYEGGIDSFTFTCGEKKEGGEHGFSKVNNDVKEKVNTENLKETLRESDAFKGKIEMLNGIEYVFVEGGRRGKRGLYLRVDATKEKSNKEIEGTAKLEKIDEVKYQMQYGSDTYATVIAFPGAMIPFDLIVDAFRLSMKEKKGVTITKVGGQGIRNVRPRKELYERITNEPELSPYPSYGAIVEFVGTGTEGQEPGCYATTASGHKRRVYLSQTPENTFVIVDVDGNKVPLMDWQQNLISQAPYTRGPAWAELFGIEKLKQSNRALYLTRMGLCNDPNTTTQPNVNQPGED